MSLDVDQQNNSKKIARLYEEIKNRIIFKTEFQNSSYKISKEESNVKKKKQEERRRSEQITQKQSLTNFKIQKKHKKIQNIKHQDGTTLLKKVFQENQKLKAKLKSLDDSFKTSISKLPLELQPCSFIVKHFLNDPECSIWFKTKVNPKFAKQYYQIIKRPMWLIKVKYKLYHRNYSSFKEFDADMRQIWTNAKIYNLSTTHNVHKLAIKCERQYLQLISKVKDLVPSISIIKDTYKKSSKAQKLTTEQLTNIEENFEKLPEHLMEKCLKLIPIDNGNEDEEIELEIDTLPLKVQSELYKIIDGHFNFNKSKEISHKLTRLSSKLMNKQRTFSKTILKKNTNRTSSNELVVMKKTITSLLISKRITKCYLKKNSLNQRFILKNSIKYLHNKFPIKKTKYLWKTRCLFVKKMNNCI